MENFGGVLVCATNFEKHLDPAVMRRFACKVRFDYLTGDGNVEFFGRILAPLLGAAVPLGVEEKLRSFDGLTPGDFKAVYLKRAFGAQPTPDELLADLEGEVRMKQGMRARRIGIAV